MPGHQGSGSRAAGIAVTFQLIQAAHARWRAVNAPHLVPVSRASSTSRSFSRLGSNSFDRQRCHLLPVRRGRRRTD
jgi:hypothetical protein